MDIRIKTGKKREIKFSKSELAAVETVHGICAGLSEVFHDEELDKADANLHNALILYLPIPKPTVTIVKAEAR